MDTKNEIIKEQKKELRTKVKEKISKLSRRETEESDKKILHQKNLLQNIKMPTQFSVMSVQKKKLIPFRFCRKYWTVEKDWVFLNVPETE